MVDTSQAFDEYIHDLAHIELVVLKNDFQLFFTIRDGRRKDRAFKFRKTTEAGYTYRQYVVREVMRLFRRAYRIRGGKKKSSQFYYFSVHESGIGETHNVADNHGHVHIAVGWNKESEFYSQPTKYFNDFCLLVSGKIPPSLQKEKTECNLIGSESTNEDFAAKYPILNKALLEKQRLGDFEPQFKWIDICYSLKNDKQHFLIQDKKKVASYMAKIERGLMSDTGRPFYKKCFGCGLLEQPSDEEVEAAYLVKKEKLKNGFERLAQIQCPKVTESEFRHSESCANDIEVISFWDDSQTDSQIEIKSNDAEALPEIFWDFGDRLDLLEQQVAEIKQKEAQHFLERGFERVFKFNKTQNTKTLTDL